MELDYRNDVEIDESNLDREWKRQAELMFAYGKAKAEAQYKLDLAREKLDLLIAEKDLEVRNEQTDRKRTEAWISNMITSLPSVQQARKDVNEAKRTLNVIQAAVEALQHKKAALENLVRLFGMSYFAEPVEAIENRGTIDHLVSGKVQERIKKTLNKEQN